MKKDEDMTMLDMIKTSMEAEFVKRVRSRLVVRDLDLPDPKFVRLGRDYDGGYVMLDDFEGIKNAYSGGIADDVSWDEAIAERGIDVFMYDPTIDQLPKEHPKFHWVKEGLIGIPTPKYPELKTLSSFIEKNGHVDDRNMILKLDIEGTEYGLFQQIELDTLLQFKQIVVEFHDLMYINVENIIGMALDKLNATHQLVHVHANNFDTYLVRGGLVLPNTIEGTFLRRSDYKFIKSRKFFPTALDRPCHPKKPEINLGYWG